MIPKIICWLFGHKLNTIFMGDYEPHWHDKCPRCGFRLSPDNDEEGE